MKKILLAFQFLTIIPVKIKGEISEKELGEATVFFPLVGAFQGVLLVTVNLILIKVFPTELTNGLLILMLTLSNGGFHLEGLADTFDAIASHGDRERKLAIMKDSTTGPVGVIAIVLALLLKFLALNSLFHFSLFSFYFSLLLMPVFSRWVIVPVIFHGESARQEGLGKIFIENTGMKELVVATLLVISFWLLACGFSLLYFPSLVTGHFSYCLCSCFTSSAFCQSGF